MEEHLKTWEPDLQEFLQIMRPFSRELMCPMLTPYLEPKLLWSRLVIVSVTIVINQSKSNAKVNLMLQVSLYLYRLQEESQYTVGTENTTSLTGSSSTLAKPRLCTSCCDVIEL